MWTYFVYHFIAIFKKRRKHAYFVCSADVYKAFTKKQIGRYLGFGHLLKYINVSKHIENGWKLQMSGFWMGFETDFVISFDDMNHRI